MPEIVDYDPRWPAMYEEEQARLLGALGPAVVAIEHFGSTSVPGLPAKPIIDIIVAVKSFDALDAWIESLGRLGYGYVPEFEVDMPERRYFRKPAVSTPEARTHHVHIYLVDEFYRRPERLFRDYLLSHPEIARQYAQMERTVAAGVAQGHITDYTEAKTPFITSVLELAKAESREQSST